MTPLSTTSARAAVRAGIHHGATPWLRRLARHERAVTATLVGMAVLAGLSALRPAEVQMVAVVAAAHPLAGGTELTTADLTTVRVPARAVPDQALRRVADVVGLVVASPMSRGELLTAMRLAGPSLLDSVRPGSVAAPVRVADGGTTMLLHVGDHIDVLAVPHEGGTSHTVASDAIVLVVPVASAGLDDGALVVVACPPAVAQLLAAAAVSSRISLVLRGH